MKTCILFFTGTGNTYRTVNILKGQLEIKGEWVEIVDISQKKSLDLSAYGKIGFVFPVYCLGIPLILKDFINDSHFSEKAYFFAIANCSSSPGIASKQISKLLRKDNKQLNLFQTLMNGANNNLFINLPGTAPILSKEDQQIAYFNARKEIIEIAEYVANSKDKIENTAGRHGDIKSFLAHKFFMGGLDRFSKKFSTTDNCIKCGKCIKSCPVNNIEAGIKWNSRCQACLRCFTLCPKAAIKHGKMKDPRMYTRMTIQDDVRDYIHGGKNRNT